jgi:hypothetical protein
MNAHPLPTLACVLLLAACASTGTPEQSTLVVPLVPAAHNAGSLGRATLMPAPDGTRIELFFTGAGMQPTSPLHVYTYLYAGRCNELPATPAIALTERVLVQGVRGNIAAGRRGAFTLSHLVPLPLPELASGRFALALRSAPADGGELLYCGDLRT